jgi:hypothetical protein
MTKIAELVASTSPAVAREVRPFLFLEPKVTVSVPELDAVGLQLLAAQTEDDVPALVRSLVNHTIALQNRGRFDSDGSQPIAVSVLNRRRRAGREWVQAVVAGKVDVATQRAVATQWLPTLAGNSVDAAKNRDAGASCIEFLRGGITALIFAAPAANLLPEARALHVLETVLAVHLRALLQAAPALIPIA